MSLSNFNNPDFKDYVLQKIKHRRNQKMCSKLRSIDKNSKSFFEEVVNCASTKQKNLKGLTKSGFSPQIKYLKLSVPDESKWLKDLCCISTEYFFNIISIKMRFVSLNQDKYPEKKMVITIL
eukprot:TRINITY_DN894_c1_g1_i1.p3 TRINITY_DN894_c1_g1~~TRINITY_DN894_c1_g1_i1.p3  ORF type:complete len:122 (-),score=5.11 TRINITY_DN894_c1_g1_i1:795-1160(-)